MTSSRPDLSVPISKPLLKKIPDLRGMGLPHAATSGWMVSLEGVALGVVYRAKTSVTGFKHGRCVGQIPVQRWFFRLPERQEDWPKETSWGTRGMRTRDAIVAALCKHSATKEAP